MGWSQPKRLPGDLPEPRIGDGLSRPKPDERVRTYTMLVRIPGCPPMKVCLPAATPAKAKLYASNRWPLSEVEVLR